MAGRKKLMTETVTLTGQGVTCYLLQYKNVLGHSTVEVFQSLKIVLHSFSHMCLVSKLD